VQTHQVVPAPTGRVTLTHEYWYDALGRRVLARTYADTAGGCGNPPQTSPWPEVCQQSTTRATWDGDFLLREARSPGAWNASAAALDQNVSDSEWYGSRRNMQAGAIDVPLAVWSGDGVGLVLVRNWRGNVAGVAGTVGGTLGYEPVWPAAQTDVRHAPDARTSPPEGNNWWGSLVADQKDATGLLYRRNRMYDPQTGRFTQEDPIGLAGGLNLYGYAGGDPINNHDPFGLELKPIDARSERALNRLRRSADEAAASSDSATAAAGQALQNQLAELDAMEDVIYVQSRTFGRSGFGKVLAADGSPTGDWGVQIGGLPIRFGTATKLSHELGHAYFTLTTGQYDPRSPGPSNNAALRMDNLYRATQGCASRQVHNSQIPFGLSIPSCR